MVGLDKDATDNPYPTSWLVIAVENAFVDS